MPYALMRLVLILATLTAGADALAQNAPTPEHSPAFALQFRDDVIPHPVFGVYVMPGETVSIKALFTRGKNRIEIQADTGTLTKSDSETWRWTASDEPGHTRMLARASDSDDRILLNVFVKTPFDSSKTSLNGYRIGRYEQKALRGNAVYEPPHGLVEVTGENADVRVAPHFTLGQFLCHQAGGPPRYLLLRERLLLKLELILEQVRASGHPADTLFIMSGYRTPWYNQSIGNKTRYSRHLYGGAADIFVDIDGDGMMDDLNKDGLSNRADAQWLADLIRDKTDRPWYRPFIGGLGVYAPAPHRGAFVHVDVRGYKARW